MQIALKDMSKDLLVEKFQEVISLSKQKDILISERTKTISNLQSDLECVKFQLADLKRILFGSKRERFISNQDDTHPKLPFDFAEGEKQKQDEKLEEKIEYTRKKNKRKSHPGRTALPSHLKVEEHVFEPQEDTTGLKCIGQEVSEELEYKPAEFYINRFIRPKYLKENKDKTCAKILIADLPERPINKAIAGSGLLSQIMVDKFVDHLPIYRQIERFKRDDIKINASTVINWQKNITELLSPLYQKMVNLVLRQGYIQADETPIKVLDRNKKGKTHQGYYWVYSSPLEGILFFDYRKGRGREGPKELLKNFKGYLQTDGYVVYQEFAKRQGITHVSCMAHARRYFDKSLSNDKDRSECVLLKIQKLYEIERQAKENKLSYDERKELRLDKSLPILNELGEYLYEQYTKVLPQSAIGKAISYTISRWKSLQAFLYDGVLEIDNNWVENAIRPNALGRKNYLFAGSHRGAESAAMFYSFFGTCKKHNINPYKWLKKVLEIIPTYSAKDLENLFPLNLAKTFPELKQK